GHLGDRLSGRYPGALLGGAELAAAGVEALHRDLGDAGDLRERAEGPIGGPCRERAQADRLGEVLALVLGAAVRASSGEVRKGLPILEGADLPEVARGRLVLLAVARGDDEDLVLDVLGQGLDGPHGAVGAVEDLVPGHAVAQERPAVRE